MSRPPVRVFVNAAAVKMGGVLTYFRNVMPHLDAREDIRLTVVFPSRLAAEFQRLAPRSRILAYPYEEGGPVWRRLYWDIRELKSMLRVEKAQVLLSLNFGLRRPPCPQVLWLRNALYYDAEMAAYVKRNGLRRLALNYGLRRAWSAWGARHCAVLLFPTEGMKRSVLACWPWAAEKRGEVLHYGREHMDAALAAVPAGIPAEDVLLFFPSLPGPHKNVETLLKALEIAVKREPRIRLILPVLAHRPPQIPAALEPHVQRVEMLSLEQMVSYYRRSAMMLFPSFCESFGLPLVEAMTAGCAVLAGDMATNREICGDAAEFLPLFDAERWAEAILALLADPGRRAALGERGRARAGRFSWKIHAGKLAEILMEAAERGGARP